MPFVKRGDLYKVVCDGCGRRYQNKKFDSMDKAASFVRREYGEVMGRKVYCYECVVKRFCNSCDRMFHNPLVKIRRCIHIYRTCKRCTNKEFDPPCCFCFR